MKNRIALLISLGLATSGCGAQPDAARSDALAATKQAEREGLPVGDPVAEGIDRQALDSLVATAEREHSEAVVIVKNGKLVYENYFGGTNKPIYAMSASKSFVGLAFGFLLADHKLGSLDEHVADRVPSFATDPLKAQMTYRHLLSNTSGMDPKRAMMDEPKDIEARGDLSTCFFPPGTSFQYSNAGVDYLAFLAGKLAGKPLDEYLDEKLFRPLGIGGVDWVKDTRGVPFGAGEMMIRPLDLAKVGAAMESGGVWHGAPVLPRAFLDDLAAPSSTIEPTYGLLWWRLAPVLAVGLTDDVLAAWKKAGVSEPTLSKVARLVGQRYSSQADLQAALRAALTPEEVDAASQIFRRSDHVPMFRNLEVGRSAGVLAAGWLGQFLVMMPEARLVAVRMRSLRESDYSSPTEVDGYRTFSKDVAALVVHR